jgi:hypothetical protein
VQPAASLPSTPQPVTPAPTAPSFKPRAARPASAPTAVAVTLSSPSSPSPLAPPSQPAQFPASSAPTPSLPHHPKELVRVWLHHAVQAQHPLESGVQILRAGQQHTSVSAQGPPSPTPATSQGSSGSGARLLPPLPTP